jgi:hypothetical protein
LITFPEVCSSTKRKNRLSVDSKQWAEFISLPGLPGFFSGESLATRNEKGKSFP